MYKGSQPSPDGCNGDRYRDVGPVPFVIYAIWMELAPPPVSEHPARRSRYSSGSSLLRPARHPISLALPNTQLMSAVSDPGRRLQVTGLRVRALAANYLTLAPRYDQLRPARIKPIARHGCGANHSQRLRHAPIRHNLGMMLRDERLRELFTPAAQLVDPFSGHGRKIRRIGISLLARNQIPGREFQAPVILAQIREQEPLQTSGLCQVLFGAQVRRRSAC